MKWWNEGTKEVEQSLGTSLENGLSIEESRRRLMENGKNLLQDEAAETGIVSRFFAQFNDFMVILLIAAALISFGVSWLNGEKDFIDSIIIIAIIVLNALLGVIQESKAQKALEALKKMSAPKAVVLRSGIRTEIPSEDVVVGDIMILETGGYICADGRVIQSRGLKSEESAITGESLAVEKELRTYPAETALGDRKNMVLSGSFVLGGSGRAIATATGMDTEIGRIANLLAEQEDQETPLQKKLGQTGKSLGIGALVICAIIFAMGLMRQEPPFTMFMTAVSLAVAAIPEGLPAIVTIVLAIGMQRMSKKNTIIRRLPAVETLGSAAVICSDKTGTLTQNKMKVVKISDYGKQKDEEKRQLILTLFALCNDCRREGGKLVGEPTERALAEAAEEGGIRIEDVSKEMPREGEIPFSSERKMMTTLHSMGDGSWMTVTKGAPDILFDRCSRCLEGHAQVTFDGNKKSKAWMQNGEMAAGALRVVAVAFREWADKPDMSKVDKIEGEMVFAGLAGMIDPPRAEAANAVALCKKAGIRPV
ncbi:MAG: cation-translocating P-type ATPase, partial [Anaerotignum sp.]